MAVIGNSRSAWYTRWQVLVNNLKESAALPHVAEEIAQLEALLGQARALQDRFEDHRAQAREVRAELAKLTREGNKIRGRLGANLQGKFGFDSESLIRYGYKPRPVNRRQPKAAAQAKAAGSTAAGGDDAAKTEA